MEEYEDIPLQFIEWLCETKLSKLPKLNKISCPETRKYNYEVSFNNIRSLEDFLFRWEFIFPEYTFDWLLNFEFNFLIDITINFDISLLDSYIDSFIDYFSDFGWLYMPIIDYELIFEYEELMKGIFGKTKYSYSYFDPPNITPEDILKYAKELRKKFLNDIGYEYRFTNEAMRVLLNSYSAILLKEGVSKNFIEFLLSKLLIAESKLRYNSYVDLAIVGFSIVLPATKETTGVGISIIRDRETLEPTQLIENIGLFDTVVGYAHVGYSHVSISRDVLYSEYGAEENRPTIPPALRDKYLETMD
ncbi:MAG: hypothetical protein QXK24_07465, partial [Ignisphaera sp.]